MSTAPLVIDAHGQVLACEAHQRAGSKLGKPGEQQREPHESEDDESDDPAVLVGTHQPSTAGDG